MKRLRWSVCVIAIVLALCVEPLAVANSAVSGKGFNPVTQIPWKIKIADNEVSASNISVAIGGARQYPILSYTGTSGSNILAIPAVAIAGNCGINDAWFCQTAPGYAVNGETSRMAYFAYQDSFKVAWAYRSPGTHTYKLQSNEYSDNLDYLTTVYTTLVDPYVFNQDGYLLWDLIDPPALAFDKAGNPHLAFVLMAGNGRILVYAHKLTHGTPTFPCNTEDTLFQCDIIYEYHGQGPSIHPDARIGLTSSGDPRISYFDTATEGLMYAYPQSNPSYHPNCGPGGNTWRCIEIDRSSLDDDFYTGGNVLWTFEMAIGPASPHFIIRSQKNGINYIRYAAYVSSGGNCGEDYALTSINPITYSLVYRWQCDSFPWDSLNSPVNHYFSLQVDSLDYPVIAFNSYNGNNYVLKVAYPAARVGATGGWRIDTLDSNGNDSGYFSAFALGKNDSSLIAYMESSLTESYLKIVYQNISKVYLPSVRRCLLNC